MKHSLLDWADRVSTCLDTLCRIFGAVFLGLIVLAASVQVAGRYFMGYSPPWIEEITRHSFIWMIMLGTAVLVKSNGHAVIDLLVMRLKGKARRVHKGMVQIAMLACALVLLVQGVQLIAIVYQQLSPALRISMAYVYAALPVGGAIIAVQCVNALLDGYRDRPACELEGV